MPSAPGRLFLKDFVPGKYASLEKNPEYWGHDERHPQNQIPYIDKLKIVIIPDEMDAVEAMRTGKIDCMNQILTKGLGN